MEVEELENEFKKICREVEIVREKVENIENLIKSFVHLTLIKSNSFEKEILEKVKNDEKAFEVFLNFVIRNRRDFLLSYLKKKIIEKLNPK